MRVQIEGVRVSKVLELVKLDIQLLVVGARVVVANTDLQENQSSRLFCPSE